MAVVFSRALTLLVVGALFFVICFDGDGQAASAPAKTPASQLQRTPAAAPRTLSQRINGFFEPIVESMKAVLFWDPFAALGLHDPTIYDEQGRVVLDAKGRPRRTTVPFVVVWLIAAGLFFTIKLRLINFRGFKHAIFLVAGRYNDPQSPGDVTHFEALATALSATVGLGNISGVAIAISIGGPGATFWLIIAGLLGMATKFTECTLGVKYRVIDERGQVSGGPMYYLRRGLANKGRPLAAIGAGLGGVYALLMILGSLGGGNMFQANQSFALLKTAFPALAPYGVQYGIVLAILVGAVIIGGIKDIARVTGKIVPLMAGLYVSVALFIIFANIGQIGEAFSAIFWGALDPPALKGGFLGVMILGFRRAAFSNEAGVGTASIAHSAAKTNEPIAEGVVALHEPFVDTVVICTLTALVLIFTGYHDTPGLSGAALTSAAFGSVLSWFPYVLAGAIFLFAFSTQIAFSYYGLKCFDYVFGGLFRRVFGSDVVAGHTYRAIFLLAVVVGAASKLGPVMAFSDMIVLSLAFPNTLGLYLLSSEVKADLDNYWERLQKDQIPRFS